MPQFRSTSFSWGTGPEGAVMEEWSPGAARISAPIYVRSAFAINRIQAASDLLGYNLLAEKAVTVNGTPKTRNYLSRSTPFPYPVPPGPPLPAPGLSAPPFTGPPLWATALTQGRGAGYGKASPTGMTDFNQYRYDLTFTAREYQVKEDGEVMAQGGPLAGFPDEGDCLLRGWANTRYITRRLEVKARAVRVPVGLLEFTNGVAPGGQGLPYTALFGFKESYGSIAYTHHLVPYSAIPWNTIKQLEGRVNANAFDVFDQNTLLFQGMEYDAATGPLGDLLATCRYNFGWLPTYSQFLGVPVGWQGAFGLIRPAGYLDYDFLRSASDHQTLPHKYAPITVGAEVPGFDGLFRPDQP